MFKVLVDYREEEIPKFVLSRRKVEFTRVFRKDQSVFAKWKQDTSSIYQKCIEHDTRCWRLNKMIKDPEQLKETITVVTKYFGKLKEIFTELSSDCTHYPTISLQSWTGFCLQSKIVDKNFLSQQLEIIFFAARFEEQS